MKQIQLLLTVILLISINKLNAQSKSLVYKNPTFYIEKSFPEGSKLILWTEEDGNEKMHKGIFSIHNDTSICINQTIIPISNITKIDIAKIRNRYLGPILLSSGVASGSILTYTLIKYGGGGGLIADFTPLFILTGVVGTVIIDVVGTTLIVNNRKTKMKNNRTLSIE